MNQNLFRQFACFSSNALGNWLAVQAAISRGRAVFGQNLSSSEKGARIQFTVRRPWGRTQ